jgi:ribosomal protein S18 acetylase RimI-like enzyme
VIFPLQKESLNACVELAKKSFIESHGSSAAEKDILHYCNKSYTREKFLEEMENPNAHFFVWKENGILMGYSKMVLNTSLEIKKEAPFAKLERIYFLKEYIGGGKGKKMYLYNEDLAKSECQKGIYLNVWTENKTAIDFYLRHGFTKIADTPFKISETHSNPNYLMLKKI